ncbi:MAG: acyl-[acyl-carrier-protein]--UDP-N-acetylglucosamine O-acyltransferase, partial [Candidatus Omnitrophica bacterium]|nr:acyl-[acyl-carrier-protein]--UDP-N-acetylglucosamine O-acyltransferase [Candidatus Omnitrophota bacterium]
GNNNLFMAYTHIAHDCKVGNDCIIANNGTLAGHVTVEDKAVIGGLVAIHQFVRVGSLSIIGGCSKVVQDIPPYSTCDGHPARVYGLNLVGLRRHNVSSEGIKSLSRAFKILFNSKLSIKHALERIEKEILPTTEISHLIDFIKGSQRGIAHSCYKVQEEPLS